MKLKHFRILNFRSIKDSGRLPFSADGITALVGQNESGKSAVLDALMTTFSDAHPVIDDIRLGEKLPTVILETESEREELDLALALITNDTLRAEFSAELTRLSGHIRWEFFCYKTKDNRYLMSFIMNLPMYNKKYDTSKLSEVEGKELIETNTKDLASFRDELYDKAPGFVLFEESSGLLPNTIDVAADGALAGEGSSAALNFLKIAGIDLNFLRTADSKSQTAILRKANRLITDEFRKFWRQNIGMDSGIELDCAIHQYPLGTDKAAQSYLEFLISDGDNILHPKQRSKGTIWFLSFFLQLRASEMADENHFYLLDEPGANLHERAQEDVIRLFETISTNIPVLYATHSPHLIRHEKIGRIIAVERDSGKPGHPTRLINSHQLGAARKDTLSPIYSAMGVSFARQTAIKDRNNIILEELSAQYYLSAFKLLTNSDVELNFLAATGVNNIPMLANLFLGWGLQFVILVDDEPSSRKVISRLKRDMFLDNDEWAKKRIFKISGCEGIEDIFESVDYQNIVGENNPLVEGQRNSKWAKLNGAVKAIHALKFWQGVESGEITAESITAPSMSRIAALIAQLTDRIENYASNP